MSSSWLPQMPWDTPAAGNPEKGGGDNPLQAALDHAQNSLTNLFSTDPPSADTVEAPSNVKADATQHPASFAAKANEPQHGTQLRNAKLAQSWSGRAAPEEKKQHVHGSFAVRAANNTKDSYRSFINRQRGNEESFRSRSSDGSGSPLQSPNRDSRAKDLPWSARMPTANLRTRPTEAHSSQKSQEDDDVLDAADAEAKIESLQKKADKLHEKWQKYLTTSEDLRAQMNARQHPVFDAAYKDQDGLAAAVSKVLIEAEDREQMARREHQLCYNHLQETRNKSRTYKSRTLILGQGQGQ